MQLFLVSGFFGFEDSSFLMKGIFFFLTGTKLVPVEIEVVPGFGSLPSPPGNHHQPMNWNIFQFCLFYCFFLTLIWKTVCRLPPKNGEIAPRPNTRVVKCRYYVSQKQNGINYKIHSYSILLTCIFKFTARLIWTNIIVLSNLSNWQFTTWQYYKVGDRSVRGRPECD